MRSQFLYGRVARAESRSWCKVQPHSAFPTRKNVTQGHRCATCATARRNRQVFHPPNHHHPSTSLLFPPHPTPPPHHPTPHHTTPPTRNLEPGTGSATSPCSPQPELLLLPASPPLSAPHPTPCHPMPRHATPHATPPPLSPLPSKKKERTAPPTQNRNCPTEPNKLLLPPFPLPTAEPGTDKHTDTQTHMVVTPVPQTVPQLVPSHPGVLTAVCRVGRSLWSKTLPVTNMPALLSLLDALWGSDPTIVVIWTTIRPEMIADLTGAVSTFFESIKSVILFLNFLTYRFVFLGKP